MKQLPFNPAVNCPGRNSESVFDRLRHISRVPENAIGLANRSCHGRPDSDFVESHHDISHKSNRKPQRTPEKQEQCIQRPLARKKVDVDFREQHAREPSCRIAMSGPRQDFCVFASENPRIGSSVAKHHDPEPIRRKTAYDLFRGQVLRVRVRFIGERWSEYRDHGDGVLRTRFRHCRTLTANHSALAGRELPTAPPEKSAAPTGAPCPRQACRAQHIWNSQQVIRTFSIRPTPKRTYWGAYPE